MDYSIKQVYSEVQGYQQYLYDASTLVTPIERPVFSSTEDKTLEWKRWF